MPCKQAQDVPFRPLCLRSPDAVASRLWGAADEEEEEREVTDRAYWEKRGTKATVKIADACLEIVRAFDAQLELKYNKFYIGLATGGQA